MLFYDNITDAGFVFNSREKARWCNTQIMAYAAHHWGSTYNVSLARASYKSTRLRFGGLRSLKISEWIRVHGPKSRIQNLNHLLQFHCFTVSDISIMNLSHCPCLHPLFYPPLYSESPSCFHVFLCVTHWMWLEFLAWEWAGGYLLEQGSFPMATPGGKMASPHPATINC